MTMMRNSCSPARAFPISDRIRLSIGTYCAACRSHKSLSHRWLQAARPVPAAQPCIGPSAMESPTVGGVPEDERPRMAGFPMITVSRKRPFDGSEPGGAPGLSPVRDGHGPLPLERLFFANAPGFLATTEERRSAARGRTGLMRAATGGSFPPKWSADVKSDRSAAKLRGSFALARSSFSALMPTASRGRTRTRTCW